MLYRTIVMLGLIVGFLAITVTAPFNPTPHVAELAQADGQTTEDAQQPEVTLKALDAIPSTAHVSLVHEYLLIDILPDLADDEAPAKGKEVSVVAGSKVLKILFRRIISPNAP